MSRVTLTLLAIIFTVTTLNAAQPAKARVPAGIGLLLLPEERRELVIYREPKIERLIVQPLKALPALQFITVRQQQVPIVVTSSKPGFYRVVYDDGEREGWIDAGRSDETFLRWHKLLPGRKVMLISGLRKEFYTLRSSPTLFASATVPVEKGKPLAVIAIDNNWMQIRTEAGSSGWLRWQDENGRLVIGFGL